MTPEERSFHCHGHLLLPTTPTTTEEEGGNRQQGQGASAPSTTTEKEEGGGGEAAATAASLKAMLEEKGPWLYELYAVLMHSGSALGGHYYAYIRSLADQRDEGSGQW